MILFVVGDFLECLEDIYCVSYNCSGSGIFICENEKCVCIGEFKE